MLRSDWQQVQKTDLSLERLRLLLLRCRDRARSRLRLRFRNDLFRSRGFRFLFGVRDLDRDLERLRDRDLDRILGREFLSPGDQLRDLIEQKMDFKNFHQPKTA